MRTRNTLIVLIIILVAMGFMYVFVHGDSNSTSTSNNMTLNCVRMFYSDDWEKGYVVDLAKFCNEKP